MTTPNPPESNKITEEMKLQDKWYEEAKIQTIESFPAFIEKLCDYEHDYATICHAAIAAALGAAHAVDHSPQGGMTGFQASIIGQHFLRKWLSIKSPIKIIEYEHLLYPQYDDEYLKINVSTMRFLQEKAKAKLLEYEKDSDKSIRINTSPKVIERWKQLASGIVPVFELRKSAFEDRDTGKEDI